MNFQPYIKNGEKSLNMMNSAFRNLPWVHNTLGLNTKNRMLDEIFHINQLLKNAIIHPSIILLHNQAIQKLQEFRNDVQKAADENLGNFLPLKNHISQIDTLISEFKHSQTTLHQINIPSNPLYEQFQKYITNYNQENYSDLPAIKAELDQMKISLQTAISFFSDALDRIEHQGGIGIENQFADWQLQCEYQALLQTITQIIKGM